MRIPGVNVSVRRTALVGVLLLTVVIAVSAYGTYTDHNRYRYDTVDRSSMYEHDGERYTLEQQMDRQQDAMEQHMQEQRRAMRDTMYTGQQSTDEIHATQRTTHDSDGTTVKRSVSGDPGQVEQTTIEGDDGIHAYQYTRDRKSDGDHTTQDQYITDRTQYGHRTGQYPDYHKTPLPGQKLKDRTDTGNDTVGDDVPVNDTIDIPVNDTNGGDLPVNDTNGEDIPVNDTDGNDTDGNDTDTDGDGDGNGDSADDRNDEDEGDGGDDDADGEDGEDGDGRGGDGDGSDGLIPDDMLPDGEIPVDNDTVIGDGPIVNDSDEDTGEEYLTPESGASLIRPQQPSPDTQPAPAEPAEPERRGLLWWAWSLLARILGAIRDLVVGIPRIGPL